LTRRGFFRLFLLDELRIRTPRGQLVGFSAKKLFSLESLGLPRYRQVSH